MKPTLVIGASTNPGRYAYLAINRLRGHQHPVIAYGPKGGTVADVEIETEWNPDWKVDTVTLYINPQRLEAYEDRIIALKPKRVIFNPGTESSGFIRKLRQNGIDAEIACTLVLLSLNDY
jgi:predicted CoA-binding protein